MNILFITSNRIGDAILSTGILEKISKDNPEAALTIAAGPLAVPLFAHVPQVQAIWSFPKKPYGFHWWQLWRKALPTHWDLVVDIRGSLITSFLRTKKKIVWRSKNEPLHKVESLGNLLGCFLPPSPIVTLSSTEKTLAATSLSLLPSSSPLIGFGLGANWSGKIWPAEHFASLAKKISSSEGLFPQAYFLLLGNASERSLGNIFISHLPPPLASRIINKMGDLNLLETAAFLKHASVFIGNDSGLMHLAAASNCPTLGLFGPSKDLHYRPWGPHADFVRTDHSYETLWARRSNVKKGETLMSSLSVDKVHAALTTLFTKGSS